MKTEKDKKKNNNWKISWTKNKTDRTGNKEPE